MTVSQIRYFLTVAQAGSISRAAEQLYVSQPAVSRQIAQLEQELEVRLFHRTNQGIALTEAGREFELFFRTAERGFQELQDRYRVTQEGADGADIRGTVNIGCAEGWDLSRIFPRFTAEFTAKYPGMTLNLSGYNHDQLIRALERGEADAILTNESFLRGHERISSSVVTRRRGMLLFSAHHPLAGKAGLALADFSDEPFYVTAPPSMQEATIELYSLCADAEFLPKIEHVPTLSSAYMKLSGGSGVLLCNDLMMAVNNPIFAALPLHIERGVSLAWLTENTAPTVKLFITELQKWFRENPEI